MYFSNIFPNKELEIEQMVISFIEKIEKKYLASIIADYPNAMWNHNNIDRDFIRKFLLSHDQKYIIGYVLIENDTITTTWTLFPIMESVKFEIVLFMRKTKQIIPSSFDSKTIAVAVIERGSIDVSLFIAQISSAVLSPSSPTNSTSLSINERLKIALNLGSADLPTLKAYAQALGLNKHEISESFIDIYKLGTKARKMNQVFEESRSTVVPSTTVFKAEYVEASKFRASSCSTTLSKFHENIFTLDFPAIEQAVVRFFCGNENAVFDQMIEKHMGTLELLQKIMHSKWELANDPDFTSNEYKETQPLFSLLLREAIQDLQCAIEVQAAQRIPLTGKILVEKQETPVSVPSREKASSTDKKPISRSLTSKKLAEEFNNQLTKISKESTNNQESRKEMFHGFTDIMAFPSGSNALTDLESLLFIIEIKSAFGEMYHDSAHTITLDQLKAEELMVYQTLQKKNRLNYGLLTDCFAISFCLREGKNENIFHSTPRYLDRREFILTIYFVLTLSHCKLINSKINWKNFGTSRPYLPDNDDDDNDNDATDDDNNKGNDIGEDNDMNNQKRKRKRFRSNSSRYPKKNKQSGGNNNETSKDNDDIEVINIKEEEEEEEELQNAIRFCYAIDEKRRVIHGLKQQDFKR